MGISPTGEKLFDFEVKFGGCKSPLEDFFMYVFYCTSVADVKALWKCLLADDFDGPS